MKIFQLWLGEIPEQLNGCPIKECLESVKKMAEANGIEYELYRKMPDGLELPKNTYKDMANKTDLFRFHMLALNPDWMWVDADVMWGDKLPELKEGKAYYDRRKGYDKPGIGVIINNGDKELSNNYGKWIVEWKNGPMNTISSLGGFVLGKIIKDNLCEIIPDGFYNHYRMKSWKTGRIKRNLGL